MRTYIQLTQAQRYQIYALKKTGHSYSEITEVIGVHNQPTAWAWNADRRAYPELLSRAGLWWSGC